MRTRTIELNGKEYWITYSVSVELALEAKGLKPADIVKNPTTTLVFDMLMEMLRAGYRWAKKAGKDPLEPPKDDDLADALDMAELHEIVLIMGEVASGKRNVEAEPEKKTKARASAG